MPIAPEKTGAAEFPCVANARRFSIAPMMDWTYCIVKGLVFRVFRGM